MISVVGGCDAAELNCVPCNMSVSSGISDAAADEACDVSIRRIVGC